MDLDGLGLEPWEVLLVRRMPKKQFYRLFIKLRLFPAVSHGLLLLSQLFFL